MTEGARKEVVVVDESVHRPLLDCDAMTLEELAEAQGVTEPMTVEKMAQFDIFESDEEIDEFIAYTYAARRNGWA